MKKVLLVNPHQTSQFGFSNAPLGLLYLAGTLKKNDIPVEVIDGYLVGWDGIRKKIDEIQPDYIGITSYTPGRHKALQIAQYAKMKYPNIITILGGAHPTIMWRQLLQNYPFIDICAIGEGEQTLLEIVSSKPRSDIKGIAYKLGGKPHLNELRTYTTNLDDIPFPAWDLCEIDKYPGKDGYSETRGTMIDLKQARVPFVTSRGCTGSCQFCSTWWIWRGYRHRSGKNVVDELQTLYEKGFKHFVFEDDAMTLDRQAVVDMCDEIIRRDIKIAFFCTTRVDAMDEDLAFKLREAGCYELSLGVESGSPTVLKTINKKIDLEKSRNAIEVLHQAGIKSCALIMIGNVGETDETINETVKFLQDSGVDTIGTLGMVWVFPGTQLYGYCMRKKMIDDSYWLGGEEVFILKDGFNEQQLSRWAQAVVNRKLIEK